MPEPLPDNWKETISNVKRTIGWMSLPIVPREGAKSVSKVGFKTDLTDKIAYMINKDTQEPAQRGKIVISKRIEQLFETALQIQKFKKEEVMSYKYFQEGVLRHDQYSLKPQQVQGQEYHKLPSSPDAYLTISEQIALEFTMKSFSHQEARYRVSLAKKETNQCYLYTDQAFLQYNIPDFVRLEWESNKFLAKRVSVDSILEGNTVLAFDVEGGEDTPNLAFTFYAYQEFATIYLINKSDNYYRILSLMEHKTFIVWDSHSESNFIPKSSQIIDLQVPKHDQMKDDKYMPSAYWELSQSFGCKIGFSEKTLLRVVSRASAHPSIIYYNLTDVAYLFHVAILELPQFMYNPKTSIGSKNNHYKNNNYTKNTNKKNNNKNYEHNNKRGGYRMKQKQDQEYVKKESTIQNQPLLDSYGQPIYTTNLIHKQRLGDLHYLDPPGVQNLCVLECMVLAAIPDINSEDLLGAYVNFLLLKLKSQISNFSPQGTKILKDWVAGKGQPEEIVPHLFKRLQEILNLKPINYIAVDLHCYIIPDEPNNAIDEVLNAILIILKEDIIRIHPIKKKEPISLFKSLSVNPTSIYNILYRRKGQKIYTSPADKTYYYYPLYTKDIRDSGNYYSILQNQELFLTYSEQPTNQFNIVWRSQTKIDPTPVEQRYTIFDKNIQELLILKLSPFFSFLSSTNLFPLFNWALFYVRDLPQVDYYSVLKQHPNVLEDVEFSRKYHKKHADVMDTMDIRDFWSENQIYINKTQNPIPHSHGQLRDISSFSNFKLINAQYSQKYPETIDHCSRFHAVQQYASEQQQLIRYMYSEEDFLYLFKHSKRIRGDIKQDIILKKGSIKNLQEEKTHVFSDCHFYEGVEEAIIDSLSVNKELEIFTSALEVTRDKDISVTEKEFKLTIKNQIMYYNPNGSQGYVNRLSAITSPVWRVTKHQVWNQLSRSYQTIYIESTPQFSVKLAEDVFYTGCSIKRSTEATFKCYQAHNSPDIFDLRILQQGFDITENQEQLLMEFVASRDKPLGQAQNFHIASFKAQLQPHQYPVMDIILKQKRLLSNMAQLEIDQREDVEQQINKWWFSRMWTRFKRLIKIEYSPNEKFKFRNSELSYQMNNNVKASQKLLNQLKIKRQETKQERRVRIFRENQTFQPSYPPIEKRIGQRNERQEEQDRATHFDPTLNKKVKQNPSFSLSEHIKIILHRGPVCTCESMYSRNITSDQKFCQFDHCDFNALYGLLFRMQTFKKPDPDTLLQYSIFLDKKLPQQLEVMKRKLRNTELYSIDQFISEVIPKKRQPYRRAMETLDQMYERGVTFDLLSKANEHQPGKQEDGIRPRIIGNPDPYTKCGGSYLTRIVFNALKKPQEWEKLSDWTSGIASGLSVQELSVRKSQKLEKLFKKHPVQDWDHFTMSVDGSSHDAHQHEVLMKLVDLRILKALKNDMFQKSEIGLEYQTELFRRLTTIHYKITSRYAKKQHIVNKQDRKFMRFLTAIIKGLVMSGHPFVTSSGNTLRCITYIKFLEHMISKDYDIRIYPDQNGDDGIHDIFVRKNQFDSDESIIEYLTAAVHKYIGNSSSTGLSGLGQTITELKISRDPTGHEFLSMMMSKDSEVYCFTRLPEKINVQATFIEQKNPLTQAQFNRMQHITLQDLPSFLQPLRERFDPYSKVKVTKGMQNELQFNWQYKTKVKIFNPELDWLEPNFEPVAPELTLRMEKLIYDLEVTPLDDESIINYKK